MRRTLLSASLLSGLLLGAAVPLLGTASAAPCPTWTDASGDAGVAANGTLVADDETVDITAVKVEQTASELVATFTVPELGEYNSYTSGDRFRLAMSAGGTSATVFTDRDDFVLGPKSGVIVGNTSYAGGWSRYDLDGKKVVVAVPHTLLSTALAKPFAGLELKSLAGSVVAQVSANQRRVAGQSTPGPSVTYLTLDSAPAPDTVALVGGKACDGAAGTPFIPAITTGAMPTDLPAANCTFHTVDATGDAKPINANAPNEEDLDITGVTYRTTGDWFMTYVKVVKLGTNPQFADGHRFSVDFVFNGHTFTVAASAYRNAQSATVRDTIASTGSGAKTVQMSVDSVPGNNAHLVFPPFVESGSRAVFDTAKSMVTIAVPVADIQKYGQAPFAGATLTAVNVKSAADYWRNSFIADYSSKTNSTTTDKWVVGDNKCFTTATKIALTVVKTRSLRTVVARLTTPSGQAIAGKTIVFSVNGRKTASPKTGVDGTAVLKNVKPGSTVKAQFLPAPGYLGSSATKKV